MFTHLHLHTEYSLLDGACRIDALMQAAKELGQESIAVTDHGVMYGAVDFYKAAKKHGLKPIIGCEVYVAPRRRTEKNKVLDREYSHLILLCKNQTGYKNLIHMVSLAFTEGFYAKPRIDHELLEKHHEGLICLSACIAGEIPRQILKDDYEGAKETALWYVELFGEGNYYLELQDHGLQEQKAVNDKLVQMSEETGIPLVATNDVHYIRQADSRVQQVLICIQTNHVLGEDTGLEFHSQEFYLKSEAQMAALFSHVPEALENTQVIAQACNLEFEFGNTKLPYFEVPGGEDHFAYFKRCCYEGMRRNYGEEIPREYIDRLEYELNTIHQMGYTDYYLIVADFINYARRRQIPVGPGRGSGAGSIAAYCMGITSIDPMQYQLLFERFLNPQRISMPDFDIDFCYERRGEVIDYVNEKYGADHVAQIVTFGTLAARAAIRDVGRALGIPYATVDSVAKLVPNQLGITIEQALKDRKLRAVYDENAEIRDLIDLARQVEGMPRNTSTHAAGVVITHDPVSEYVPLATNDDLVVTQYGMTTLEELGLLKMDFLGLRTLTVINDCQKMVNRSDPDFDAQSIPLDDASVYALFGKGRTDGIFQFESSGMKRMLTELKPERLEDLIAATSLYRPGPAKQIDTYIANRHHPENIQYKTPLLAEILDTTYGCMIYQEQVMQIFRTLAGFSYARADIVRKAMSKKKTEVMERERKNFLYGLTLEDGTVECEGAVNRGVPEDVAQAIFAEMYDFTKYAFNKSHAAAYAYVAYQTAYLKCHYPCEFMAALLTSVLDSSNKIAQYIEECRRMGLKLSVPNVNTSMRGFTASGDTISYGLLGIKNVGSEFIRRIIEERQAGPYQDLYDFCSRLQGREFNKRAVESLIRAGALDNLGANRRQMLEALPNIAGDLESDRRRNIEGQIGFFELTEDEAGQRYQYPDLEEYPKSELLNMEKEMTGLYLSGHPMDAYQQLLGQVQCAKISELLEADQVMGSRYQDNSRVRILAIINRVTLKTTRNASTMAFLTVEDTAGTMELLAFPKILTQYAALLQEGNVLLLEGKLTMEDDKDAKLILEQASDPAAQPDQSAAQADAGGKSGKRRGLYLRLDAPEAMTGKLTAMLSIFDGTTPVVLYYNETKQYDFHPNPAMTGANDSLVRELKRLLGEENVVWVP